MEKILCHNNDLHAQRFAPHTWQPAEDRHPWRSCSYCGSIHPNDLLESLKNPKTELHGSDWKYGWPHKFYVIIQNPNPDIEFDLGGSYQHGVCLEKFTGKLQTMQAKWYNIHLKDIKSTELFEILFDKSGIAFRLNENGDLTYLSPYEGYQR